MMEELGYNVGWCLEGVGGRGGLIRLVREALLAGADPNSTGGPCKTTCLMEIVKFNSAELVDLLLSCPGIKVNAKDKDNWTALHHACAFGNVASLSSLLAAPGLLLNERNKRGNTPIIEAINYRLGGAEIVEVMADMADVDLDVEDKMGRRLEELAKK